MRNRTIHVIAVSTLTAGAFLACVVADDPAFDAGQPCDTSQT